jgi:putative transposase
MPRKSRFFVPGLPVHAVQRGHNRAAVFFADLDCLEYLKYLRKSAQTCGCAIHAYVLMTNHVHLLFTPEQQGSAACLFQSVGRQYVGYINKTYRRSGTLWEGRYKANVVESARYLLACMRYIEMNPMRAGMVDHPAEYRWSSYAANALGDSNAVLSVHAEYLALGSSEERRQFAYRKLFDRCEDIEGLERFRAALQTGTPLGDDEFKREVEATLGVKVGFARRGRPRKVATREQRVTGDRVSG